MFRVCHAVLSVQCSLVVTCWVTAGLLALLYVMFSYVFVTSPYGVLGKVWYLTSFCHFPCRVLGQVLYWFLILAFFLTLMIQYSVFFLLDTIKYISYYIWLFMRQFSVFLWLYGCLWDNIVHHCSYKILWLVWYNIVHFSY